MVEGSFPEPDAVASALKFSLGLLERRLRQLPGADDLTMPEQSVLARLDRSGPATASHLARAEQVTPQAMGPTVARLEERGVVTRSPDPADSRRILFSVTGSGLRMLRSRRSGRVERMARVMADNFTRDELRQLEAAVPLPLSVLW